MAETKNTTLIDNFLAYMRSEKGATENTIQSYQIDLSKLAAGLLVPLATARRTDIQKYVSDLLATGISARTVARHLSCFRHFYSYLLDEGEIRREPTRNLPVPKQWKTIPRALSQSDFEKMLASVEKGRFYGLELRDRAMLLTFFGPGWRESELVNLKLEDVDFDSGFAKVWAGKGEKDGVVPLSPPAIAALRKYIEDGRPAQDKGQNLPWVFLSRAGRQITRQEICIRVQKISERALGRRVSPHWLRHGFATALIEGGADIRDVQVLMRHSDLGTTMIYIHLDLKYLRRIYYASHPRAHIAQVQG